MAKLSSLVARKCTTDVYRDRGEGLDLNGNPAEAGLVVVDYRPSQYSQDLMADLEKIAKDEKSTDAEKLRANTEWIKRMVCGWNVEAEESTSKSPVYLPVEDEHIKALGLPMQNHIIRAITEELGLGERKSEDSSSTS